MQPTARAVIENQPGGSQEGAGGRGTERNKLTFVFKAEKCQPSGLAQEWATGFGCRERGVLVWGDGAGGTRTHTRAAAIAQLRSSSRSGNGCWGG